MKTLLTGMAFCAPLLFSLHALAWGNDCDYSRNVEREISLDGVDFIMVAAGAGKLEIQGDDDLETVVIEAKLCAEKEAQLAEMDVESEQSGDTLRLKTELARGKLWNTGYDGSYIDLTLHVPADAKMDVKDSSGEARVEGIGSLVMVDSSGELTIENVKGDVNVTDSSGALNIEQVTGNVLVTDSSGSISVYKVTGDFTVEVDSSGGIEAEQIGGDVLVKTDSSGSIEVEDIVGNFTVGRDSSGGIYHKNVGGAVSLPN